MQHFVSNATIVLSQVLFLKQVSHHPTLCFSSDLQFFLEVRVTSLPHAVEPLLSVPYCTFKLGSPDSNNTTEGAVSENTVHRVRFCVGE